MDVAVAIYAVGGMFGALPAGYLADLIGRWGQDQSRPFRPEVVQISAHLITNSAKVEVEPEVGIKVKGGVVAQVGLAMSGLGLQSIQVWVNWKDIQTNLFRDWIEFVTLLAM